MGPRRRDREILSPCDNDDEITANYKVEESERFFTLLVHLHLVSTREWPWRTAPRAPCPGAPPRVYTSRVSSGGCPRQRSSRIRWKPAGAPDRPGSGCGLPASPGDQDVTWLSVSSGNRACWRDDAGRLLLGRAGFAPIPVAYLNAVTAGKTSSSAPGSSPGSGAWMPDRRGDLPA